MSHSSFDPRQDIFNAIATTAPVNPDSWDEYSVVTISDRGIIYTIPIYLAEDVKSAEQPIFPFIDMNLMLVDYDPHDIGATTRKQEAYIDVGVWFTASNEVNPTTFGKAIVDKIMDEVRSNQETCSFSNLHFANIRKVRLLRESEGRQVVYHYVIEIYVIYYNLE